MVLKVNKLNKKFDGNEEFALHNIAFSLKDKDRIVLLGTEGAGKTSVLRIIAGLEKEFEGEIEVNKKDLCVVLKNTMFRFRSVYSNLIYPIMARADNPRAGVIQVEDVIKTFNLENAHKVKIRKLDKFTLAKVYLARAYLHEASLYLIDDILEGLNKKEKENILKYLELFNNSAIVHTASNIEDAKLLADKVVVLNYGYFHGSGKIEDLEKNPKDLTIFKLLYPQAKIKENKDCFIGEVDNKKYKFDLKSEKYRS